MLARAQDSGATALHHAVREGRLFDAAYLLSAGASPAATDAHGCTPLHQAASPPLVGLLLRAGATTDARAARSLATPLHAAAQRGGAQEVALMLRWRGAKAAHLTDARGHFPSALATLPATAKLLDRAEAVAVEGAQAGELTLLEATSGGLTPVVDVLLTEGEAEPDDVVVEEHGLTALHVAASNGHFTAARCLLQGGANPGISDAHGDTPLLYATYARHFYIIELLLNAGASPHHANPKGYTPFQMAAYSGDVRMAALFGPECKAIVDTPITVDDTAPDDAAEESDEEAEAEAEDAAAAEAVRRGVAEELSSEDDGDDKDMEDKSRDDDERGGGPATARKPELEPRPSKKSAAAIRAAKSRASKAVAAKAAAAAAKAEAEAEAAAAAATTAAAATAAEAAKAAGLQKAADLAGSVSAGDAALDDIGIKQNLHDIVRRADNDALRTLYAEGSTEMLNLADRRGRTPLAIATRMGHVETVRLLLELGADVNYRCDARDNTPLHVAVSSHAGNLELARLLLERGADPMLVNSNFSTVHDLCSRRVLEELFPASAYFSFVGRLCLGPAIG
jgi:ankyrin repeat protein